MRNSLLIIASLLTAISGCELSRIQTGGNYPAVTDEQLVGKQMTHRTGQAPYSFTWVFNEHGFVIEGQDIPMDLTESLLGPGLRSTRIEGTWRIHPDETIHFETTTSQPAGHIHKAELPIFFTGVIRIQTSDAQYCFPAL